MATAAKQTRKDTRTTGKGMPPKTPQDHGPVIDKAQTPSDASVESSLALPHERDQSTDMTAKAVDPAMKLAAHDLRCGRQDTSNGLETDRAYQKQK